MDLIALREFARFRGFKSGDRHIEKAALSEFTFEDAAWLMEFFFSILFDVEEKLSEKFKILIWKDLSGKFSRNRNCLIYYFHLSNLMQFS